MASKKDLVDAHTFNRRRLITSFVSGAPGGREVEPVNYARVLVGGTILAVLVVVGAAVSGYLKPATPTKWDQAMIVAKDGSRFVYSKDVLYPIANTASARLFAASQGELQVYTVSTDEIAKHEVGVQIGIRGAPDSLPAADAMVDTGWTSCVNDRGAVRTTIERSPKARSVDGGALLVTDAESDEPYLIADGRRYALPDGGPASSAVRSLRLDGLEVHEVPRTWLSLFALGAPVEPFTVADEGDAIETGVDGLSTIGQPLTVDGEPYVVVRTRIGAGLLKLTSFADRVYRSSGPGAVDAVALQPGDVSELPTVTNADVDAYPTNWPAGGLAEAPALCAGLDGSGSQVRRTVLVEPTAEDLAPAASTTRSTTTVQSGRGALVTSATGGSASPGLFLVDSTGTRFAVGATGDYAEERTRLGYGKVDTPGVPAPWLALLAPGPRLSVAGAQRAVDAGS